MPVIATQEDGTRVYRCKTCGTDTILMPDQRPRCLPCDRKRAEKRRKANPAEHRKRVEATRLQQRLERMVTNGIITIDTAIEMGYVLPEVPKGISHDETE